MCRPPGFDTPFQTGCIESGIGQAAISGAVLDEAIPDPELQYGQLQPLCSQEFNDTGSRATGHDIFFDRHDSAVPKR